MSQQFFVRIECMGDRKQQIQAMTGDTLSLPRRSFWVVFPYAIRHSLTTKAFTELLQLIAVHLPKEAAIPRSVHNLKRFFVESYPELQPIQHYYCSCCQRPLLSDSSICNGHGCSGGSSATFITIPAGGQLKRAMEGLICISKLEIMSIWQLGLV